MFDSIVIGGGCIGLTIANELATSGNKVLLLEKDHLISGATGKSGGMIRAFHQSERLTQWAQRSLKKFSRMESFNQTGSLYIYPLENKEEFRAKAANRKASGVELEVLTQDELEARFPEMKITGEALYEKKSGYLNIQEWFAEFMDSKADFEIYENEMVVSLDRKANSWNVVTENFTFETQSVVVSTGIEISSLIKDLGDELTVKTIKTRSYSSNPFGDMPHFIDVSNFRYGRSHGGNLLLGHDSNEGIIDSPKRGFELIEAQDLYANDREGILKEVQSGLFVATGWGGTGFKLAPAIAEDMNELVNNFLGGCHV